MTSIDSSSAHRSSRYGAAWKRLSHNRWLAILLTGVLSFLLCATISGLRMPVPRVHDEFSYLLAADTFTHGRLTNPTHPMWQHLESFHVIHEPSYASKYPPGQGLFLAIGQITTGHPIVGAWLATALATAAVCWMLAGWLPPKWAALGGLLAAIHPGIQLAWGQSYWGGSVAMLGGALLFGALPRLVRQPRIVTALWMSLGIVLLGASRPFEGLMLTICSLVWLTNKIFAEPIPFRRILGKVVLPSAICLTLAAAAWAFYNARVTGDPLRMPYEVHESTYAASPLFLWRAPRQTPSYHHPVMQKFFTGWATNAYRNQQSVAGLYRMKGESLLKLWTFFLGVVLTVPLVTLPLLLKNVRISFGLAALLVLFAACAVIPWSSPHYVAPGAGLMFLVVLQGMRILCARDEQGRRPFRMAVPAVLAIQGILFVTLSFQYVRADTDGWQWRRSELLAQLEATPGRHLVIVHYSPKHNVHAEWVYNRADIDGAKVVWARSMGTERDAQLVNYFRNRNVWTLAADEKSPRLVEQRQF